MKREYMEPRMEAIEIAVQQMLAFSGGLGGDPATEPAKAPGLFDDPAWDEVLGE